MRLLQERKMWKTVTFAAVATVVAFASPAAAAVPSSTTVQATPSSASVGQSVVLSATVSCTADPSGGLGVTFFDGSDLLNTVPVDGGGQASYTTTFSTTGTHTITAAYNGNTDCGASNAETTVTVSETPVPPTPPGRLCLLACGGLGLVNFTVGDIHNEINID
ncbi:Ig-like domain-containing protein [Streptomyces sp. NPDC059479]|uniref:Ig-like domain-containing protein n=1 Tax=Streptomyces sp. NPDC059479 TaxID=3346848 RepID=UPI0036C8A2B1